VYGKTYSRWARSKPAPGAGATISRLRRQADAGFRASSRYTVSWAAHVSDDCTLFFLNESVAVQRIEHQRALRTVGALSHNISDLGIHFMTKTEISLASLLEII
jgi:hypothetical protein